MAIKSYDLNADFSFTSGGNNDTPQLALNGAMRTWQATHPDDSFDCTIAAGTYNIPGNYAFMWNGTFDANAVPTYNFVLNGNGAVFTFSSSAYFQLGGGNVEDDNLCSYIATVAAGATSVQLITAGEFSRFDAGDVLEVSGLATDKGGWPQNCYYFEHVTVTNSVSGTISFTPALRNSYRQDWPYYGGGKTKGGPAMISKKWPQVGMPYSIEYNDCTFGSPTYDDGQIYAVALYETYNTVTFDAVDTGTPGYVPTEAIEINLNNVTVNHVIEWDKLIDTANINGGTYQQLAFQSTAGANTLNISGGATIDLLNCLPRKTVIGTATIGNIFPHGFHFGPPEELVMNGTVVSSWREISDCFGNRDDDVESLCTLSVGTGLITVPKTAYPPYAAPTFTVPGCSYVIGYKDQFNNFKTVGPYFQVLSVTDDGGGASGNVLVQTDLTLSAWPTFGADMGDSGLSIMCWPVQRLKITGATGCATAIDLSQPGAYGKGYGEYSKRTYDDTTSNPNWPNFMAAITSVDRVPIAGKLVQVTITVHEEYTGSYPSNLLMRFINENYPWEVDLKVAGPRTITITPTAVTGAAGNDALSVFSWFDGFYACKEPTINHNIDGESSSVWPSVTIELIADQGITDEVETVVADHRQVLMGQACM